MASVIRIKRSDTNGNPGTLATGELAYSALAGTQSNGGDRLYIGQGTETGGNAANHLVVGGKYFTDMLDHVAGTLTASSAILVDSNGKIDIINVGNITITGSTNTISSTDTNGNIVLSPNGTGKVSIAGAYTLPRVDGSANYVLTTNGAGVVSWQAAGSNLSLAGTSGTGTVALLTQTLTINGNSNVTTTASGQSITVSVATATNAVLGVASFNAASFTVTSGDVTIKSGGVSNAQLVNSSVTLGTTNIALGATTATIAGLSNVTIGNINVTGNTISSTNTNGNIVLAPNGTGSVSVNGAVITNVGTPVASTDAVNKTYVDSVAQGLNAHEPVLAATTATLASITGGTVTYNTGTGGVGAFLALQNPITTLDGYALTTGTRILVKNEAAQANNGAYVWTSSTWLTRAADFDQPAEVGGGDFFFVQNGTVNANTGWVETTKAAVVGTDPIVFVQFSGAGTYSAGSGLSLTGTVFSVNTTSTGGVTVSGNNIVLASGVSGAGLTLTNGVLDVVGTANRISVAADSIDIAATYVGQTSISTLGTVGTGTWQASTIAAIYGGTGQSTYAVGDLLVGAAGNTLTKLAIGTNGYVLTSNGTSTVWSAVSGLSSGFATTATNIANGTAGQIPYQVSAGNTSFVGPGTAGQFLQSNGTSAPTYVSTASMYVGVATSATTVLGGTAGQLVFQSAPNVTSFAGPGTVGQILVSNNSSGPVYTNTSSIYVGQATYANNVLGGAAGGIVYQTSANASTTLGIGTAGQILTVNAGATAPQWSSITTLTVNTATNVGGGAAGSLVYQSASGTTAFIGIGAAGTLLQSNGSTATYVSTSSIYVGSATTATNIQGGAAGGIPYQTASGQTVFLPVGAAGKVLQVSTSTGLAVWGDIDGGVY